MKAIDVIKEELNVQFVNKEINDLEKATQQITQVANENPALGKEINNSIALINKKLNGLKYAVADYTKKEKMSKQSGVGTQTQVQAQKQPVQQQQKQPVQQQPKKPVPTVPQQKQQTTEQQ